MEIRESSIGHMENNKHTRPFCLALFILLYVTSL
jgi:hypothetical protein